ncbi:fungal-specific transcription factor domain-containing protein [Aspergillus pseudoustus]|uniref:Fungal-specific transcription factor domain-containing protein n=1 Tax=Aspergillus pseudoustus TaxID=1810923 RepID=A0ABR4JRY2_9EURO
MEDENGPDSSGSPDNAPRGPEVGHACNSCRKRKLRCSRELPACQHCRKSASECTYETKRAKPGMKAGALDNIHRRLDVLERSLGRQQATIDSLASGVPQNEQDSNVHNILSALATTLQGFSKSLPPTGAQNEPPSKRRRLDNGNQAPYLSSHDPPLPDDTILSHVLEAYFIFVHPWTPVIHEARFRRRLVDDGDRDSLHLIIHSMVLVAHGYVEDQETSTALGKEPKQWEEIRDWIVSQAMKQPSVENLQVLVIIASSDIGNGQASQAWPLVGSLSRMVEYLQLTVEHDEPVHHLFSQPYKLLPPPKDWTEAEERRRVFWSIFALDRFCSVSMGWNTSLTADDVRRRLPCDGITWRKENPVVTPYFGIWDKSAGRIGNPIAFLPTHPVSVRPTQEEGETPSDAGTSPGGATTVDMSTVGAYAYCIEATESLSRVTTYFLQQKVNLNDQKEFGAWLTRFKELDLRLVHWKMLLPQKWTVNVTQQALSRMDPNLTLAHITHNASMILLHQPIAFPLPEWPFKSRMPSVCSMDTCQSAAVEVASITNHYLKSSLPTSPLSSQLAFCVFIAARALLLYWQHSEAEQDVTTEFWVLIQCLDAMATRWAGTNGPVSALRNLPAKYSTTLTQLHRRCSQDRSFKINIAGYTTEVTHTPDEPDLASRNMNMHVLPLQPVVIANTSLPNMPSQRIQSSPMQARAIENGLAPSQPFATQQIPTLTPNTFSLNMGIADSNGVANMLRSTFTPDSDDPMAISQMLLDQQFTDLDRVISYNDGLFGAEYEGQRW